MFNINNDELEQERVRLEMDLADASFGQYSIEYPRHNAIPSKFDNSYIHHLDSEDDEDAYSPRTVSTAGHHASALTFSAGLRRGRRDSTASGLEYDPERRVEDIIARVDPKLSLFDLDPSKSHYTPIFDPVVVDNTAELERVLGSGHLRASLSSSSSSSDSDSPRKKLSDALRHVSFSPKRPRTSSPRISNNRLASPLVRNRLDEQNIPTPRPSKHRTTPKPEVRLQPPTPSSATRETHSRNPLHNIVNQPAKHNSYNFSKNRVHLPDVTGLTSAVESPAKGAQQHQPYDPNGRAAREAETRLISTLTAVQNKLRQLEDENSISRRRVRELEHELEICKEEVVKERTRVLEKEQISNNKQPKKSSNKGKEKAREREASPVKGKDISIRYREVVEEKKALEALVTSLRDHLTRLTGELSNHQKLLLDLKALREEDVEALRRKSAEVDRLKAEVERLAGEVEVLKSVVEEGLKERRATREQSKEMSQVSQLSYLTSLEETEEAQEASREEGEEEEEEEEEEANEDEEEGDDEDDTVQRQVSEAPIDPDSIPGSSRERIGVPADRTMRTDRATVASSTGTPAPQKKSVSREQVDRIAVEVEDRRSERSAGSMGSPSQTQSYFNSGEHEREDISEVSSRPPARPAAPTPGHANRQHQPAHIHHHEFDTEEMPIPHIREPKLEKLFMSAQHDPRTCTMCQRRRRRPGGGLAPDGGRPLSPSWLPSRLGRGPRQNRAPSHHVDEDEGFVDDLDEERERILLEARRRGRGRDGVRRALPPQTVLARVIKEMEDDFSHYKSVYEELADQYKLMDAVSDVPKRNLLAHHLREVIDIIERKGDQIASLYDLLEYKDRPTS